MRYFLLLALCLAEWTTDCKPPKARHKRSESGDHHTTDPDDRIMKRRDSGDHGTSPPEDAMHRHGSGDHATNPPTDRCPTQPPTRKAHQTKSSKKQGAPKPRSQQPRESWDPLSPENRYNPANRAAATDSFTVEEPSPPYMETLTQYNRSGLNKGQEICLTASRTGNMAVLQRLSAVERTILLAAKTQSNQKHPDSRTTQKMLETSQLPFAQQVLQFLRKQPSPAPPPIKIYSIQYTDEPGTTTQKPRFQGPNFSQQKQWAPSFAQPQPNSSSWLDSAPSSGSLEDPPTTRMKYPA